MDKIYEIIKWLGLSGILTAGFVWLIKKIIELFFNKDLERFKSNLEKEAIKYRIQFLKLHEERCEVIKEVYKKIIRTQRTLKSLVNPIQLAGELSTEEKQKIFVKEANEFLDYYLENRIYFEEDLALKIDELEKKYREIWNQFNLAIDMQRAPGALDEWSDAFKKIEKDIPDIKQAIEKDFRKIIGI